MTTATLSVGCPEQPDANRLLPQHLDSPDALHLEAVPPGMCHRQQAVVSARLVDTATGIEVNQLALPDVPADPPPLLATVGSDNERGVHTFVAGGQLASETALRRSLTNIIQAAKDRNLRRRESGGDGTPRPQPSRRRPALDYLHHAHLTPMTAT